MEDNKRSAVAESSETESLSPDVAALLAERDELARQAADLQEQVLRGRAEFDNFRKRRDKEQLEFAEYAGVELIRALLPSLDDFERALKAAADVAEAGELTKGVSMVYQRLLDNLTKQGLEPVSTEGQRFDPNLHHAIKMVENDDLEDHTILQEYQKGYRFKGRLLRAAMVEVSVKK